VKPRVSIPEVYKTLLAAYGHQHWWPGNSRFEIMAGAILVQNTAWTNVEHAIANLKQAWALSPEAILRAPPRRLANWLKPSGYFNVKAKRLQAMCRWIIGRGSLREIAKMPTATLRAELLAVHGIGRETADAILLYAFNRPVFVIDAYTRRIFVRLGLVDAAKDYETLRACFENALPREAALYNEYHALIVTHGKDICRTRPRCSSCALQGVCQYARQRIRRVA
jgi:endonuclease III related protein